MTFLKRLFGATKKTEHFDSKQANLSEEITECVKCGGRNFEHNSYWDEYNCENCGWTSEKKPKGKVKIRELQTEDIEKITSEAIKPERKTRHEFSETQQEDLSGDISWQKSTVKEGYVIFECVKCGKKYSIKAASFMHGDEIEKQAKLTNRTMEIITSPAPASYNIPAFIIAIVIGVVLLASIGGDEIPLWLTGVSIAIWCGLSRLLKMKWSKTKQVPVWFFDCTECGKRNFVASDGRGAFIGDLEMNAGEK